MELGEDDIAAIMEKPRAEDATKCKGGVFSFPLSPHTDRKRRIVMMRTMMVLIVGKDGDGKYPCFSSHPMMVTQCVCES